MRYSIVYNGSFGIEFSQLLYKHNTEKIILPTFKGKVYFETY